MEEQTTTAPATDPQAVDTSTQAPAPEASTAASQPDPASTNAPAEPSTDDNLAWLQKKGIDPSDPEAIGKVAEMYRNAEKTMHQSTAKASELEKALVTPPAATNYEGIPQDVLDNPYVKGLIDEVAAIKETTSTMAMSQGVNSYFAMNPEAKAYEAQMAEIVTTRPEIGQLVRAGYLGIPDLLAMAQATPEALSAAKAEGGKEALQTVASNQQGRAVQGHATTSAMAPAGPTRANRDEWYAGLTSEERAKPETQTILNSLL